jgi:glycosyltransferase XagB
MSLDVIIPVKNEEQAIPELTRRLDETLRASHTDYRIIYVDDKSTDQTLPLLLSLSKKYPILIHSKQGRAGKAFSILEGAKFARSEYVAMIDGDLQYPPEAIPEMLKLAPERGVIVANRKIHHTSMIRKFVSRANRLLFAKFLLGLECDSQSGLKVFRRDILDYLDASQVDAWAIDMPLLYTAQELGYSIGTVDIDFAPRKGGSSKVNILKTSTEIGLRALKIKLSPRKILSISPTDSESVIGAGIIYKKRRFVTHTQLNLEHSAVITFTAWQKTLLISFLIGVAAAFIFQPLTTGIVLVSVLSIIYFLDVVFNFFLVAKSLRSPPELDFSDSQISSLKNSELPVYSILCPLYKESKVLPDFVSAINSIEWPKNKLDVLLLLEEGDAETIEVAKSMNLPDHFRIIIVPDSQPKTKPKACNYGLSLARGEYLVIYDAEDKPDPLQLKKAYLGFRDSSPHIVCLQAKLNYYNPDNNLLTRLFTAEYSLWFDITLPGLQSINTTIPLGGTSNHFKTSILRSIHGWDAFNVTEDCDLGARLFKLGYRTAIINSTTLEEANSQMGNWLRQRSRWIKGYIQTYLVHNRHPLGFIKSNGIHAFIFQLVVGGKIAFMLINPLLWLATISYFALYKFVGSTIESLYPQVIFYLASFSLIFGNFMYMYYYMIACAKKGQWSLIKYIYFVPFYWLMVSLAALKALNQLIWNPHYWEKTKHGLHIKPQYQPQASPVSPVFPVPAPAQAWRWSYLFGGGALVAASVTANFFNFLYNAYLGRNVSVEEFGLVSLIGSFIYISQVPLGALSQTVSSRSAYLYGKYHQVVPNFWSYIRQRTVLISFMVAGLWVLISPLLAQFFHSDSVLPFLLFTPVWILASAAAVDTGFLSGNMKFAVLAVIAVIESASKFILSYLFIRLGWDSYIYAALSLSTALSFYIGWRVAASLKKSSVNTPTPVSLYFPGKFFTTSFLSKVSSVAFLSVDLILAKHYLPPVIAGEYALLSLVGKMVFFAGSLFSQFITPLISRDEGAGSRSNVTFYKIFGATVFSSLVAYLVVGVAGNYSVPILLGPRANSILPLLPWYGLAIAAFTIAHSIVNYHQTRHQYELVFVSVVSTAMLLIGFSFFHQNLTQMVGVVNFVAFTYLAACLALHLLYNSLSVIFRNTLDLLGLFNRSPAISVTPDKMRILVFNWRDTQHIWAGGAEVYIHELAKRWVGAGHQVTVFCGNDGHHSRNSVVDGVNVVRRGGLYTVYIWAVLYYLIQFRGKYDVVIDCENGIPFFTPLYVRLPKVLLIHHVHQNVFRQHLKFPLAQLGVFLESSLMPLVYTGHKVITVSPSSSQDILSLGLVSEEDIQIISPGIDPAQFKRYSKTPYPSFVYLGRIRHYKNIDVALKAFAKIIPLYPQARFHIAGEGESLDAIKKLSQALNLEKSVTFFGHVSEVEKVKLLARSWVMVQPSSFEGWGITVIEANAAGTPVIASNVIGLRDSVIDGKTGLLVPSGDEYALATAMERLLSNKLLRHNLAVNATVWAQSFNWDENAGLFLSQLMELIKPPTGYRIAAPPALAE